MIHFLNRKIVFYYALCSFPICLFSSLYIYTHIRPPFTDLLRNIETSLETSSPPATSVPQDDTLTYGVFVLDTLNYFLLLAYVSLGASNFVLVSHF